MAGRVAEPAPVVAQRRVDGHHGRRLVHGDIRHLLVVDLRLLDREVQDLLGVEPVGDDGGVGLAEPVAVVRRQPRDVGAGDRRLEVADQVVRLDPVVVVARGQEDRDPQLLDVGEVRSVGPPQDQVPQQLGVHVRPWLEQVLVDVVVEVAGHHDDVQDALLVQPVRVLDEAAEPVVEVHHPGRRLWPPGVDHELPELVDAPGHVGVRDVRESEVAPLAPEVDGVRSDRRARRHRHVVQDPLRHPRCRHRYDDPAVRPVLGRRHNQLHRRTAHRVRHQHDPVREGAPHQPGDCLERDPRPLGVNLEDEHPGRRGVARDDHRPPDAEEPPPPGGRHPLAGEREPVLVNRDGAALEGERVGQLLAECAFWHEDPPENPRVVCVDTNAGSRKPPLTMTHSCSCQTVASAPPRCRVDQH